MKKRWKGLLGLWLSLLMLSGQTVFAAEGIYMYTGGSTDWSAGDRMDSSDYTSVSALLENPLNTQSAVMSAGVPDTHELDGWQLWGISVGSGYLIEFLGNLGADGEISQSVYDDVVNNTENRANGLVLVPLLTEKTIEPTEPPQPTDPPEPTDPPQPVVPPVSTDLQVTISIGANGWSGFFPSNSNNLVFDSEQTALIEGYDNGSEISSVWYYLARGSEGYTEDQMEELPWMSYRGGVLLTESDRYVLYAKAADGRGGVAYASTGGFYVDTEMPVISGIRNGGFYEGDVTFTVSGGNLDIVTVDGWAVNLTDGSYTIIADDQVHKITALSKVGHEIVCEITVNKKDDTGSSGNTINGIVTLAEGTAYSLGTGKWKVAGDDTVYEGGSTFYVAPAGKYNFQKQ